MTETKGLVFNVQRFSLHDGPGIRTVVFLKGCALRCQWCDNPESMNPSPELGFSQVCCDKCGKCVPACPEGALTMAREGSLRIDRKRCTACGKCVTACTREALAVYGNYREVEEVVKDGCRDAKFFGRSEGGISLCGGEPFWQASFAVALLRSLKEAQIHTAVETSGFFSPAVLLEALPFVDLWLYDLKHLDSEVHHQLTGQDNSLILSNAALLVSKKAKVHFRMPLIPGLNDTENNIGATSHFLRELVGEQAAITLMPYHRLGVGKYQALDMTYPLDGLKSASPEYVDGVRQAFEKSGLKCLVSG